MTPREFDALKQRVERLVDDPQERRKLLLQALHAEIDRHAAHAAVHRRAIERLERRRQRCEFLFGCVAELLPEIQPLEDLPLRDVIARVEPQYPDLAEQLRELIHA